MSEENKKAKFGWHSGIPTTFDDNATTGFPSLVGGFTYPDSCRITNMNLPGLEFDTSTDEAVYCDAATPFTADSLSDLKASLLELQGLMEKSDAFQAGIDAKFLAKTPYSVEITLPNGTDKLWYVVEQKKNAPLLGAPNDKFKFDYAWIIKQLPATN